MALFASKVIAGSKVRAVTVPGSLSSDVRAYGFAQTNGYAFVLFNNTLKSIAIDARVSGSGKASFTAALSVYGKTQYDKSKENHWTGPVGRSLGTVGTTVPLMLPAYSLSVLTLRT